MLSATARVYSSGETVLKGLVQAACQWSTPAPPWPLRRVWPFSTMITEAPARAALMAAWQPAMPPPRTSTSAETLVSLP